MEIQIWEREGVGKGEQKHLQIGPITCPLKRPQDVIFIFLHCTNTFFSFTSSSTSCLIFLLPLIPYSNFQSPCPPKCTTKHPHRQGLPLSSPPLISAISSRCPPLSAATSRRSAETGTPLDSTWRTRHRQFRFPSATSTTCWSSSATSTNSEKLRSTSTVASSLGSPIRRRHAPVLWDRRGGVWTRSSDGSGRPTRSMEGRRRPIPLAAELFACTFVRWRSVKQRQEASLTLRKRRRRTNLRALITLPSPSSNWPLEIHGW